MKFVLQLIQHQTGQRSEPFIATQEELVKVLEEYEEKDPQDFILTVGYIKDEESGMMISGNPLITIQTFLATFSPEAIQALLDKQDELDNLTADEQLKHEQHDQEPDPINQELSQ